MAARHAALLAFLALLETGTGRAMRTQSARSAPPPGWQATQLLTAAQVRGELTRDIIRRVIYVHINEIRHCYQRELQMRPTLAGRLTASFWIDGQGQVHDLQIARDTLRIPSLLLCISGAIARWEFPATQARGITVVNYPFQLRPRPPDPSQPATGVQVSDEELEKLGIRKEDGLPGADILF